MNHRLSLEVLADIRDRALEQVALMDRLKEALAANDIAAIVEVARSLVELEKQVVER